MRHSTKVYRWALPCLGRSLAALAAAVAAAAAESAPKLDARYPFRTNSANAHLPWYRLKPLEFPPHHSDRRISGELVHVDFIRRRCSFRASRDGALMDFVMPPFGFIQYLGAESDLRDVPLGRNILFFLNHDTNGEPTQLVMAQDQFSMDVSHGFSYRLDEVRRAENRLITMKRKLGPTPADQGRVELRVTPETRVWRGEQSVPLDSLQAGDELLFTVAGRTANDPGWCAEIWVGPDTHRLATTQQQKKFRAFTKTRGLPGWIERTHGDRLEVTLFSSDPKSFRQSWLEEFEVGNPIRVVVVNDELRSWNSVVDKETATLVEMRSQPADRYGTSGTRLVIEVRNMLEGFRHGRAVRVLPPGWRLSVPFYGEALWNYGYGFPRNPEIAENTAKEYPAQFPFRTDFGNAHLPWYRLQPGVVPPRFSEHTVLGELAAVNPDGRSGVFLRDRTGERCEFALTAEGAFLYENQNKPGDKGMANFKPVPASVRRLGAEAKLTDLPLGERYRFHLYEDERGGFTRASFISDEFSTLALHVVTYRVLSLPNAEGKLRVARQIPRVINYNSELEQPPDIGQSELRLDPATQVWRGTTPATLAEMKVGDALLVNLTSEQPGRPSRCTEVWIVDEQARAEPRFFQPLRALPAAQASR
jgi:hypothetical protein